MNTHEILVVDDEVGIRELLSEILGDEGYRVAVAQNATEARAYRQRGRPDLVLLDIWMPDSDGITLLKEWAGAGLLTMPVIMMSGHGTIDTAVEATKIGASDFLEKPIALQKLLSTVKRALKKGEARFTTRVDLDSLGRGAVIRELKARLTQIANLHAPTLLTGERGVGTEHCARFLHQPNTPWVAPAVYAQIADAPLEVLQAARDGLLFVREAADMNKLEQKGLALLLTKLEKYNVRLVCATAYPLPALVESGAFNGELFNGLSELTVHVPSLRAHREDIPELASSLLAQYVETQETGPRHFATAALNALRNYHWPGNVQQLQNCTKTLAVTALNEEISLADVNRVLHQFDLETAAPLPPVPLDLPLREARDLFERYYFEHHIRLEAGNMSRVAEKVGLERTHLYRKLKQLDIRFARKSDL